MTETFDCVPPTICRYKVSPAVLRSTAKALCRVGQGRKEAAVLWQGRILTNTEAEVTKLIVPKQIAGPAHFNITVEERLRIIDEIDKVGEFILIQLHTHPNEAFHSEADDRLAVTKHLHAISIVIPHFGNHWSGALAEASVHMNLGGGLWRKLTDAEVLQFFEIPRVDWKRHPIRFIFGKIGMALRWLVAKIRG
jgi:hypothetical protein